MSTNAIDFCFRVIESIAFTLHALLGITEPWTGCLKSAFRDKGNMAWWGWPVAGCLLAIVAFCNIRFADDTSVILALQWYVVTFHCGAIWYHIKLGHNPVVGIAPGSFIPIALLIIGLRLKEGWWYILPLGTCVCATIAKILCNVLVKGPSDVENDIREEFLPSPRSAYGTN